MAALESYSSWRKVPLPGPAASCHRLVLPGDPVHNSIFGIRAQREVKTFHSYLEAVGSLIMEMTEVNIFS